MIQAMDAEARALFNLLDYRSEGSFNKEAVTAAQGGDFGLFEKMGPDEHGAVSADQFVEWIQMLRREKVPIVRIIGAENLPL